MLPNEQQIETFIVDHYVFISHEGFKYETSLVRGKDTLAENAKYIELYQAESKTVTKITKPVFIFQQREQQMQRRVKKPGECRVCDQPALETSLFCKQHTREPNTSTR